MEFDSTKSSKIRLILILAFCSSLFAMFSFLFFTCISLYSEFDIEYDELMYEELTFSKYEKLNGYKAKKYIVYFEEYEKPFEISTISDKKLDKTSLSNLKKGESIKVYYMEDSSKKYDYEICEFSNNSVVLLSLSDYVETNQSNQTVGMIAMPILAIMCLFLDFIFIYLYKTAVSAEKSGKINKKLGAVKIEHIEGENIIRIYNSPEVCSLVINDKVVDQQFGITAAWFSLNGSVNKEGRIVRVEAKMGFVNIRLYVDGKYIGKAFIGFG